MADGAAACTTGALQQSEHFLRSVADNKDAASNLIGRFGVGFYSVFMVADQVAVTSRSFAPDAAAARGMPVDEDGRVAHDAVEHEEEMLPGRAGLDVKPQAVGTVSDVRQAAGAAEMAARHDFPVVDNPGELGVIELAERPAYGPVVRHDHRLPAGIVEVRSLGARILAVPEAPSVAAALHLAHKVEPIPVNRRRGPAVPRHLPAPPAMSES